MTNSPVGATERAAAAAADVRETSPEGLEPSSDLLSFVAMALPVAGSRLSEPMWQPAARCQPEPAAAARGRATPLRAQYVCTGPVSTTSNASPVMPSMSCRLSSLQLELGAPDTYQSDPLSATMRP